MPEAAGCGWYSPWMTKDNGSFNGGSRTQPADRNQTDSGPKSSKNSPPNRAVNRALGGVADVTEDTEIESIAGALAVRVKRAKP
jgi:hypothetical protein